MEIAMRVPTVRVKNDGSPDGFVVINETDLSPSHELWPEQGEAFERSAPQTEAAVALRCMAAILSRHSGKSLAEWMAQPGVARLEQLQAAEVEITVTMVQEIGPHIPDDWQDLHWKTQVKLAKVLGFEGEPTADQAKAHIAMAVAARAAQ
jgi:hypothetical protein